MKRFVWMTLPLLALFACDEGTNANAPVATTNAAPTAFATQLPASAVTTDASGQNVTIAINGKQVKINPLTEVAKFDSGMREWAWGGTILQPSRSETGAVSVTYKDEKNETHSAFTLIAGSAVSNMTTPTTGYSGVWYANQYLDKNGVVQHVKAEDGTITIDPASGTWTGKFGKVTVSGKINGKMVKGRAQLGSIAGSLEGYEGEINSVDVGFGGYSGTDGTSSFSGVWDYDNASQ